MKNHRTRISLLAIIIAVAGLGICCRFTPAEAPIATADGPISTVIVTQTPKVTPTVKKNVEYVYVTRTPRPTGTATPAGDAWTCSPGTQNINLFSAGEERRFHIHIPAQVQPGQPAALIVSIHGHSASAEQQEIWSEFSPLADKEGFIVVYPQALHNPASWDVEPTEENLDIPYFKTLLDNIEEHCSIDKRRIYVTGASNGGGMTNRLGCQFSKRIAAIGPVIGAYPFFADCNIKRPLPVIAFHGTGDEKVLYNGTGSFSLMEKGVYTFPPIPYWAATWAMWDGCASRAETVRLPGGILRDTWSGCNGVADVILYTIEGGGHVWFGSGSTSVTGTGFHASRIIWEFFKNHPLPEEYLPTTTAP